MKIFDIAILGSGASGCMCALTVASSGQTIALVDKAKFPAKKLMATGNGRCNLTNINDVLPKHCYNTNLEEYFKEFSSSDTLDFFQSLGLETYHDEEGRVYPISNSAKSVVDVIGNAIDKFHNISVFNEKTVVNIKKNGDFFKISLENEEICAKNLVFSLGGNNNHLLENLGIYCKKNLPSLCPLKTKKTHKLLANIRVSPVAITVKTSKGTTHTECGEIMFRENGLSGIAIFNCSAIFARENSFSGQITIDLMPKTSHPALLEKLLLRRDLDLKVSNFFDGLFANGLGYYLLEKCEINENRTSKQLTHAEINSLALAIKHLTFDITAPLDNNQVFSGGAILKNLDENLQSKTCSNLYICGEACDVDGLCGGYNLQWAWTSGYIVGKTLQ